MKIELFASLWTIINAEYILMRSKNVADVLVANFNDILFFFLFQVSDLFFEMQSFCGKVLISECTLDSAKNIFEFMEIDFSI